MPTNLGTTGKLILAFVTLLLGAVLIGTVASEGLNKTDKLQEVDEYFDMSLATNATPGEVNTSYAFTVAYSPSGWKSTDCPLSSYTLANGTGGVTELTETTDYVLTTTTGDVSFKQTDEVNQTFSSDNASYITYTYCGDDYMNLQWGRTAINLVAGFFALAVLLISVGLFFSVAKDFGIF